MGFSMRRLVSAEPQRSRYSARCNYHSRCALARICKRASDLRITFLFISFHFTTSSSQLALPLSVGCKGSLVNEGNYLPGPVIVDEYTWPVYLFYLPELERSFKAKAEPIFLFISVSSHVNLTNNYCNRVRRVRFGRAISSTPKFGRPPK